MENKTYAYVGRDEDGDLGMYPVVPRRKEKAEPNYGYWEAGAAWMPLDNDLFKDLEWADSPIKVELTIKKISK